MFAHSGAPPLEQRLLFDRPVGARQFGKSLETGLEVGHRGMERAGERR
jgi:hypothetical protein